MFHQDFLSEKFDEGSREDKIGVLEHKRFHWVVLGENGLEKIAKSITYENAQTQFNEFMLQMVSLFGTVSS